MTIDRYATAEDFANWEAKAARLNIFGLHYAAQDAWEAAQCAAAMGNHVREGFYRDEMATYMMTARKRLATAPAQPGCKTTRPLQSWDANKAGYEGTCTLLAVDGHNALVEPHDGIGRWFVTPRSTLGM